MIPIDQIKSRLKALREGAKQKNVSFDFDALIKLDSQLKKVQQSQQALRSTRNKASEIIGKIARLSSAGKASMETLISEAKACGLKFHPHELEVKSASELKELVRKKIADLKESLAVLDDQVRSQQSTLRDLLLRVPQPPHKKVPFGRSDKDNVEYKTQGFIPKGTRSHIEIGERLGLIDFHHAVKLAGSRSYVLTGKGAVLEQAILRMAYDHCLTQNYQAMSVPVLVTEACMEGTGYFPTGRDQSYLCEQDRLVLVGTGEVPVCAFYMNQTLKEEDLPLKLFTQTSCFRREAGSYGKDTKGLYRVHQFQKVEQVIIGKNSEELSQIYHQELLANSEAILEALELPYRVVHVCSGDLGLGAYYKDDIETWMPSRQSYGETHSCSAFLEYQARRLRIRYQDASGQIHFAHTLNNTAIASPRILIPFLEIHQSGDDVAIPKALQPYCSGAKSLTEMELPCHQIKNKNKK